jgi:DNA-binding LacI/PurR family transcriptional regulator
MTDGAIEFAAEQGLSIPDDLAIVGYDTPSPSVPCICQNVSLMAEKSVDLLIEQIDAINSKTPPRNFYITPTLSQSKDTTSM